MFLNLKQEGLSEVWISIQYVHNYWATIIVQN